MFGIGRLGRWARGWGVSVAGLPTITAGDDGKIVRVVNGAYALRDQLDFSYMLVDGDDWAHGFKLWSSGNSGANSRSNIQGAAGTYLSPSGWELNAGTTTTGYGNLFGTDQDDVIKLGAGTTTWETRLKLTRVSDGTDTYAFVAGLSRGPYLNSLPGLDGIYFYCTTGNWKLRCQASSSTTDRDTGIAVTTNDVNLKWVYTVAGGVQAYIDGVAVGAPITTNIPTNTTKLTHQWMILKSAGTTVCAAYLDWYRMSIVGLAR